LPIWLGVGGTPQSFVRAGMLGLPLMVAIIGGETRRFRPLIDLYREAGRRAGHSSDRLRVGVHSLGYAAGTTEEAADDFFPGYARAVTDIGKERGWPAVTRAGFDAQRGPQGALLIGSPEEVVEKIIRHGEALGGVSRFTFQMNAASLPHAKLMRAIEVLHPSRSHVAQGVGGRCRMTTSVMAGLLPFLRYQRTSGESADRLVGGHGQRYRVTAISHLSETEVVCQTIQTPLAES
jgi:hypothetical protein